MTKVLRCKKRSNLLGCDHCENICRGSWDELFLTRSKYKSTQYCTFVFYSIFQK